MDPITVLDFATRTGEVGDQILAECDSGERDELAFGLMRLYAHAAKKLRTEPALIAIDSAFHVMREYDDDRNVMDAADLILAFGEMSDSPGADSDLRAFGYHSLMKRLNVVDAVDRMESVIKKIPIVWNRLLPELIWTRVGRDMLARFSAEINGGA
jgi:hypothetical protein